MDIETRGDIERVLVAFYKAAFADPVLGPIFVDVANLDLDRHLPIIADFWDTVIFKTGSYKRGAFDVHRRLNEIVPLRAAEFAKWLELWDGTVSSLFTGPNADTAIRQAHRFAGAFERRLMSRPDTNESVQTVAGTIEVELTKPSERKIQDRPRWEWATVVATRTLTPVVVSLRIRLSNPLRFLPGQYCNIRVPVAGRPRPIQRAYSIASSPSPASDTVEVLVSRVDDGLVSPLLHDLKVGDVIELRAPHGDFVWSDARGPVYFIAAGTGVAPFLSMARYSIAEQLPISQTLLLSSLATGPVLLVRGELSELADASEWLNVIHTFTRDDADVRAQFHRRIDAAMLDAIGIRTAEKVYVCGWPEMVETTRVALERVGVVSSKVVVEKYN